MHINNNLLYGFLTRFTEQRHYDSNPDASDFILNG